jgi:hypothetical protein
LNIHKILGNTKIPDSPSDVRRWRSITRLLFRRRRGLRQIELSI